MQITGKRRGQGLKITWPAELNCIDWDKGFTEGQKDPERRRGKGSPQVGLRKIQGTFQEPKNDYGKQDWVG